MWKKDEVPGQSNPARPETPTRPDRPTPTASTRTASGERATIGRSITIRGEVTGDEDLLIQGKVDGSVDLKEHAVTVGPEGEVKASIVARVVTVEGTVEGNLTADEQVVLKSAATVRGDITAPRVVLEDGARFRGGVDMGDDVKKKAGNGPARTASAPPARAPEPNKAVAATAAAKSSSDSASSIEKDKSAAKATS